ncbi:MFS transporter [Nocardioides sp. SOB77]|uniref:MFS transporter n=1 Tax=Nocardioides oceani TaxID=3058369 RepID=A0ABT8FF62_9ACTN|nr:MFS transporter [Nocardioides oceani]MDN4173318.1 MFS transporter [Nocardioides oceani]
MRRPLYGWLAAEAVSLTGTRVSMVALPLFVLAESGSALRTGLVALAEMLPLVVLKVLAGPLVDRVGARRVAITCDLASVVVIGAIPLLHEAGLLSFGAFLALVAVAGGLRGPSDGAKHAMVPALVAEAGVPMERATGLHSTVERTSSMLGAALAGLLVAAVGPTTALLLDAASFGVAAALLGWATTSMRPVPTPAAAAAAATAPGMEPEPYRRQLREGWDFLRRDRVLVTITAMIALTNLLDLAWSSVLVPVWGTETAGGDGAAARVGLLFAVFSGTSAVGAVCAAAWGARLPRRATYLVAFLVCGAPRYLVLALDSPLAAVLAVVGLGGFASGFLNPVIGAVIFERIPAHLVGRVSSLTTACCFALMPFGGLVGGALVGAGGLGTAMLVCGIAYGAVTLLPALDPRWREIDRRPDPSAPAPAHAAERG